MSTQQPQHSPTTDEDVTTSASPQHETQQNEEHKEEAQKKHFSETQSPTPELPLQTQDQQDSLSSSQPQNGDDPSGMEQHAAHITVKQEGTIPSQQQTIPQHMQQQAYMPQMQNIFYNQSSFAAALQFQAQYYNMVMGTAYQHLQQTHMEPHKPPNHGFPLSQEGDNQNSQESGGDSGIGGAEISGSQSSEAKRGRRRRADGSSKKKKLNQSLRQCSTKVCEKVRLKKQTTYKEVADELVDEIMAEAQAEGMTESINEKNIRRRVYDALNVFMAMQIISKDKKEISWRGLPLSSHKEHDGLVQRRKKLEETVQRERKSLEDLLQQKQALEMLYERNRHSRQTSKEGSIIPLPFIIVNTQKNTPVDCEMDEDRTEIVFSFKAPFELHDDNEILRTLHNNGALARTKSEAVSPDSPQSSSQDFLSGQFQGSPFQTPPRNNYRTDRLTPQGRPSSPSSFHNDSMHPLE